MCTVSVCVVHSSVSIHTHTICVVCAVLRCLRIPQLLHGFCDVDARVCIRAAGCT